MANLKKTSRTAGGVVDTSASKGKADQIVAGLTWADPAAHATKNFEDVVRGVHAAALKIDGKSPENLLTYADQVNAHINKGIVKVGVSARLDDSPKFPYTAVADLPLAREQFAA